MNCPVCDGRMRTVQKHGVEVDICPDCKGVWLDRGELEKIIEMVSGAGPAGNQDHERIVEYRSEERPRERHYEEKRHEEHGHEKRYDEKGREIDPKTGRPKRRESWFGEIFDMFGD